MLITHLGHACLLVETLGARMLLDPGTMSFFDEVVDLDAVLITHQHADHLDPARLGSLLARNPAALLVVDADTGLSVPGLPTDHVVANVGDRLTFGDTSVAVLGGRHAVVYGDFPGCANVGYLFNDGELFHPGDSFLVPEADVDVLAAAIDAPWLKIADSIDYVRRVSPRACIPIHEGEARDPSKYVRVLDTFGPPGVVARIEPRKATVI
jgi:L-ascorbate metabolism protein UlaG (beta-lactamase superfamily)